MSPTQQSRLTFATTVFSKVAKTTSVAVIMGLSLFTFSCEKKISVSTNAKTLPIIKDAQNIISTRPQNQDTIMAVLKLKSPALLEQATRSEGKTQINQDLLKAVLAEHEAAIQELKNVSSEIQVIFRYKMVLNGLAIVAPKSAFEKIQKIGFIATWEEVSAFGRPESVNTQAVVGALSLNERNSSKFIGAEKLNLAGLTGKGLRVGVLDTGIDHTHAMFGGVGTPEAYKAIDPAKESTGFPNRKIVGGVDLVGTVYDAANPAFSFRIPKPDMNPLDEGGHGSHVAGTIAGLGNGVDSYNGMAPDADLYDIKVFGADGSTSDMVVIAGLEFSVDPNGDNDLGDQLDVVNLSLGSGYGNPKILYAEAVKNLVRGGTVAVISAGNSGPNDYIVGAPGTSTEALSVAASIDNGDHNWKFDSSEFSINGETKFVEAIEAATTKSIKDGPVEGKLVYVGLANVDLTEEQIAAVRGNVALVDRGIVTFNDKAKRIAAAGAIGFVLANNREGAPFKMGTTDKFEIPGIMITQELGNLIKASIGSGGEPRIKFLGSLKIEKPELIDQLTDFSSKGPRSIDGFLKPEISAPGNNVISASMGKGAEVVQLSGTSMAAPHMAGVMALVKQSMKQRGLDLSALELKNVVMGTSKTIGDATGRYAISRQGAGRIQADAAAESVLVANTPSISFGEVSIETRKSLRSKLSVRNLQASELELKVQFEGNSFITMNAVSNLKLAAGAAMDLNLTFTLDASQMGEHNTREMDGWVKFVKLDGTEVYRVPVLAVAHRLSAVSAQNFKVASTSRLDSEGALVTLDLANSSANAGDVLLFNLVGVDERKPLALPFMSSDCDMQAVGYKVIEQTDDQGQSEQVVQFGIKTYQPMTTWNSCDVSILVDSNRDGVAEQELLGSSLKSIPNQASEAFASTLLDAAKTRELRLAFEAKVNALLANPEIPNKQEALQKMKTEEKYDEAILSQSAMQLYNNSTVVVVEVPLAKLATDATGAIHFKVIVSHNEQATTQLDDVLASEEPFFSISNRLQDQPFLDLMMGSTLLPGEFKTVEMTKGAKEGKLLALFPQNRFSFSNNIMDDQAQVLIPSYGFGK